MVFEPLEATTESLDFKSFMCGITPIHPYDNLPLLLLFPFQIKFLYEVWFVFCNSTFSAIEYVDINQITTIA